jgi:hypothetical protein
MGLGALGILFTIVIASVIAAVGIMANTRRHFPLTLGRAL